MKDGWGLATDGQVLFGSDGTSTLYRMDPRTMKGFRVLFFAFVFFNHLLIFWTGEYIYDFIDSAVTDKHVIKYNGIEVRYLNELEYINNEVWANVWQVIQLFFLVFAFIHCDD